MCHVIEVAALQHETFEVLEEEAAGRVISPSLANGFEKTWESDVQEYEEFDVPDIAWV